MKIQSPQSGPTPVPVYRFEPAAGRNVDQFMQRYFREEKDHDRFLQEWKVDFDKKLGDGSSGVVVQARNAHVAKVLHDTYKKEERRYLHTNFVREVRVNEFFTDLKAPDFIMKMVDCSWSPSYDIAIIYPRYQCDLFDYIDKSPDPLGSLWRLNPQALTILQWLEERNFVHRDFRSENLFVQKGQLILGDNETLCSAPTTLGMQNILTASPEGIGGADLKPSSDLWCWAQCLYERTMGASFFSQEKEITECLHPYHATRLLLFQMEIKTGQQAPEHILKDFLAFCPNWRSLYDLARPETCENELQNRANEAMGNGEEYISELYLKIKKFIKQVLIINPDLRPTAAQALSIHASLQPLPRER